MISAYLRTSALLLFVLLAPKTLAQTFSIPWFTIDGGGALNSTGSVYAVSGTLGQPDASGPLSGGQYTLVGGFWALPVVVQTPGAPLLAIAPGAPGQAVMSWTPATPGFVLQQTATLENPNWINAPSGATTPVNVPATGPGKFYRLRRP